MGVRPAVLLPALLLLSAGPAVAHDTWLIPAPDRLEADGGVRAALCTGEEFPRSEAAAKPERVAAWEVLSSTQRHGVREFVTIDEALTAETPVRGAGVHVLAVALRPHFIEIEAGKFNEYLALEGAEEALRVRGEREEMGEAGREVYTKLAKTFVRVGEGGDTLGFARPAGHALEIVPLTDPFSWKVGGEVTVRVLLDGKPTAGLTVSSGREGLPPHTYAQSVTTDRIGVAKLTFDQPGRWYLRTHHIRRAERPSAGDTPASQWESFFASITFPVAAE